MNKVYEDYLMKALLIFAVILFIIAIIISTNKFKAIESAKDNYNNIFRIQNQTIKQYSLLIIDKNETTLIIYPNGTIWQKNGSEGYNGEQLAKLSTSYSNFINEYCDNREKSK